MMSCLKQYFPTSVSYTISQGGMFAWVTLPAEITARKWLVKALEQHIIFVPGDSFYATKPDSQTMRLNYSNVDEATMRKAMNVLGGIVTSMCNQSY